MARTLSDEDTDTTEEAATRAEELMLQRRYRDAQSLCELFAHESWGAYAAILEELRARALRAVASTNVDVAQVPTLRGQLTAFEHLLGLPRTVTATRDRLLGELQQMTGPENEEEA